MSSYVITGVSKGLGWEFLNQISSDPENIVIGIVRDKPATDKRVAEELSGRANITILEADLTKYDAVKKAAAEAAVVTQGKLDFLIANAGYVSTWDSYDGLGVLGEKPEELDQQFKKLFDINVLANIHLYNLFIPQILKGRAKKVVCITSGMADVDWVNDYDFNGGALYASSKAAMNMVTAKFNANYKAEGVLFLGICPGMVDVGHFNNATPEQGQALGGMMEKFQRYSPTFQGPDAPPDSIKAVLSVINKSSLANGDGGAFLSHFGNKKWV